MTKIWSNKLKAFSISIVTKNPFLLRTPVISIMSAINLPLSKINLSSTYAICCGEIKLGRTFLRHDARALQIILQSTFNKDIGRQFLISLSSLSFFSIHELKKKHLYLPKKLQKTLLLVHRIQVIYYFTYSLRRYTILFQTAHRRIH